MNIISLRISHKRFRHCNAHLERRPERAKRRTQDDVQLTTHGFELRDYIAIKMLIRIDR
jgi:hypothetical protein